MTMRMFVRALASATLCGIVACGDSAPPGPPTAPSPAPAPAITIVLTRLTPSEVSFTGATGQSVPLTVMASFSDGTMRDVTAEVVWEVDKPDVASIAGGVLTVRGYGATLFRGRFQQREVGPGRLDVGIPPELLMPLTGVVRDQYGRPVPDVPIVSTGAILLGGRTDAAGHFDLGQTSGPVRLKLEMFGYETLEPALTVGASPLHAQLTLHESPSPYAEHTVEADGTSTWRTHRLEARAGQPIDVLVESAGCSYRNATGVLTVRFRGGEEVVGCGARVRHIAAADEAQLDVTVSTPTTYRVTYRVPR